MPNMFGGVLWCLQPPAGGKGRGVLLQGQDKVLHGAEPGAGQAEVELEGEVTGPK